MGFRRQMNESVPGVLNLIEKGSAQWSGFGCDALCFPGPHQFIQPLMEQLETFSKPQNRNHLLIPACETLRLQPGSLKLPKKQGVSAYNQGD